MRKISGSIGSGSDPTNFSSYYMRIIFMGTPEFAVPSLQILLDHSYEVVAVVTAPDKPGGRQGIQQSAVKQFAVSRGLTVLQPEKLKNPDFFLDRRYR